MSVERMSVGYLAKRVEDHEERIKKLETVILTPEEAEALGKLADRYLTEETARRWISLKMNRGRKVALGVIVLITTSVTTLGGVVTIIHYWPK